VQIPRADEEAKDAFRAVIPDAPGVEVKAMFGNLGAFVNGNMFAGLFGPTLGVRLTGETDRNELAALAGTGPFGPSERPMSGYVALPPDWSRQPNLTTAWIERALAQVAALPAKAPKPKRPEKALNSGSS
jgi:TfoX/Sxy family transcriptional regulator of competence genes